MKYNFFYIADTLEEYTVFYIAYKGSVVVEEVKNFWEALLYLFASFYSFNELFPKNIARTLEFLQSSVLKISNKQIRVSRQISNKLVNELLEFIIDVSNVK